MTPTFVRRATLEDAQYVAANLREADRQEVLAASGVDHRLALPLLVQDGREVWAAGIEADQRAEIIFGVDPVPFVEGVGVIWLLSTDRIFAYPVEFVQRSKALLEDFHERYDVLTNFIDARNTRHIRWLKFMGFHLIRRVERFGAHSLPFIEFASIR